MKNKICVFILAFAFAAAHAAAPSAVDSAITNSARPTEDKEADQRRHPRELLKFSKIKAGDKVVDIIPGKGYFTRLFISLVGPKGHVVAYVPKEIENAPFKPVESATKAVEGAKNAEVKVTLLSEPPAESVDVIWTSQNYHDLHVKSFIEADVPAYNKVLFSMLKPGGYFIVIDHVAKSGSNDADVEKLHRIDPKVVRQEIEAAGFVFEAESKVLSQRDDHSLNVFDPAIRGKTDQFVYRFVKPKKK